MIEMSQINIPETDKEKNDAPCYKKKKLTELIETKDNEDIVKWIRDEKLSLQSHDDGDPDNTVMRQILKEAVNGDEIISEILDSFVTKTSVGDKKISSNPNSFNIKVDFSGIIRDNDDGEQESVLNDLVYLWLSYKSTPWEKVTYPMKKVVEICKPIDKRTPKKKSSPQIVLGKN